MIKEMKKKNRKRTKLKLGRAKDRRWKGDMDAVLGVNINLIQRIERWKNWP